MRRLFSLALTLAMGFSAAAAHAQSAWPTKPIRMLVGFAAGGSTDVSARLIAQALSERLGQSVIVENRAGAGGNIAAEAVAKADPDGYTLLMSTSTTFATNPNLYKSLPFNVQTDFAPVTLTAFIPNLLVVNPSVPASNVAEFIAYLKTNPGKLNFGSAGNGSSQHIAGELFNSLAGVRMTHVPYRGGAPAVNDLLGGQLQVIFAPLVEVLQLVRADKVRALGVTTTKRSPLLPDVAPIAETLPGYEIALWNGLVAPAKTPPDIIDRINKATIDALRSPELKAKLAEQGSEPVGDTPAEFKAFIDSELVKWRKLVEISGATVQ
ncbi:MAG TPA: tripartite tricarboxylate transporter substrate binding protein [Bradyrhizobium sp.]|jgi:tripartite-type tricarboxylate transporter receptor subunit TctC|nr:tripartite tricarboxylate transporter substrate binding protein [Bradyrhizobium sp.]